MTNLPCIELIGIQKAFYGIKAVDDVDFKIDAGTVHALIGENGAGKSTLMKILTGIYKRDSGTIAMDGHPISIESPQDAIRHGISIVEQELVVFQDLTVFQNIFVGREYCYQSLPIFNWKKVREEARKILEPFTNTINTNALMKSLKVSDRQIVEIAKAISFRAKYIVMDEPTSSLGEKEKNALFRIINSIKQSGVGVIYISHRMEEIFEIADFVTVMRDGKKIGTYKIDEIEQKELVAKMVGRPISEIFNREKRLEQTGEVVLKVTNLFRKHHFNDISFSIRSGEIVGMYGLIGSQRSEIIKSIFGIDTYVKGEIEYFGKRTHFKSSRQSIKYGIGLVPEDRKREGVIHTMTVLQNMTLSILPLISRNGWILRENERSLVKKLVNDLSIKLTSINQKIISLSGGNQQKVILARYLAMNPKLLILDEPTRGIDIGAKAEIHKLIAGIAANGVAVLLISSEMPEIIGACDRILVLHEGKLTAEYKHTDVTQEKLIASAL